MSLPAITVNPGDRYGRYVILRELPKKIDGKCVRRCFECRCDCGEIRSVQLSTLRRGESKSCGCLQKELNSARNTKHGHAIKGKSLEYGVWSQAVQRCSCPTHQAYKSYGGRGILVCDRWKNSFAAFLEDMGPRPSLDHTLERIDNDKGYSPENCKWATRKEQSQNLRTSRLITFRGETKCLSEWARQSGIPKATLRSRLEKGWPIEKALTQPVKVSSRRKSGEASMSDAANESILKELERLSGWIRALANSVEASNSRCERIETRMGKLEAQIALPDTFERRLPPGDEDAELPTKQKTCPTCRGRGIVAWFSSGSNPAVPCTSCNGKGYIEAIAP